MGDYTENLKLPAGPLINQLANRGRIPKELLEELWRAKEDRNYLAHEYIYGYVLQKSWDVANPRHALADLQEKARYFQELYDELYKLIREGEQERGVDRTLDPDTYKVIQEVIQEKMTEAESEEP